MHLKMPSAICFNLDKSKILSSGNGLKSTKKDQKTASYYTDYLLPSQHTIPAFKETQKESF